MLKYVLDITTNMINQKREIKTNEVKDAAGNFSVKLCGIHIENNCFNTQLTLKNKNNFDGKFNDMKYKRISMKLNCAGWKNSSFTSADVSMLGYGWGVSHYPQFYDPDLYKYQVLPRPYWCLLRVILNKIIKEKRVLDLAGQAECFSGNVLKKGEQKNIGLH